MSKDSSAKYYQNTKEKPQKIDIKVCLKKRKKKKRQYGVSDTKIYQRMKKKSLLSIAKIF